MTEQEEFEFRARLEAEQAAVRAPTTARGAISEISKAAGRGLSSAPLMAAEALSMPVEKMGGILSDQIGMEFKGSKAFQRLGQTLRERLKATPANEFEQALGTGTEIGASIAPFMGGPAPLAAKAFGLAAPALGGVAGERIAENHTGMSGEQGKMVGSFAAPLGMAAAAKALSPNVSEEMRLMLKAGLTPTPGEQTGGFLKRLERYPVFRELTSSAQIRSHDSVSTAATNLALRPLDASNPIKGKNHRGQEMNGFQKYEKADSIASRAYDEVLPKLSVKYDYPMHREWLLQRSTLDDDIAPLMQKIYDKTIVKVVEKDGSITPENMKMIDSQLGDLARKAIKDTAIEREGMHDAIRNLQGIVRDSVTRQNPEHAPQLQRINAAWNNLVRIGDAVERAKSTNGLFSPEQLQTSVARMDASLKGKAFKTGRAAMQDVSQSVVDTVGGGRNASVPWGAVRGTLAGGAGLAGIGGTAMVAGGAPLAIPAAAAAAGFGSMYTPLGQRLAQGALSGQRPMPLQTLGQIMREAPTYAPATLPLFDQFRRDKERQ